MEISEVISKLGKIIPFDIYVEGEDIIFKRKSRLDDIVYKISNEEMSEILNDISKDKSTVSSSLYQNHYYETLIRDESPLPAMAFRYDEIDEIIDNENDLKYTISAPSKSFVIKFLLNQVKSERVLVRFGMITSRIKDRKEVDFFKFISLVYSLRTIKIQSGAVTKLEDFKTYAKSFIFTLNYNIGIVLIESDSEIGTDKFLRLQRYRKTEPSEIDPPRRKYNNDLIDHFLMAQSSSNVMAIFLSYYHIMEFYFIQVFEENLIKLVKTRLTSSSFSYKKDKEIKDLIKFIGKELKIQDENRYLFNEAEALHLVLSKMVDFKLVKEEIEQYDNSLIEYYKNNNFTAKSKGNFDFNEINGNNKDVTIKSIASRIYSIRNAIVHSKDGGGEVYKPFKDDKKLFLEIPLMRFITEEVIKFNSKIIE